MVLPANPTKQQIFNHVATHLLRQKKRALGPNGGCVYRAPDGSRCAVGSLIPDEMYSPGMEHRGVRALPDAYMVPDFFRNDQNLHLLMTLQRIHDTCIVDLWPLHLEQVARMFNLQFDQRKVLDETQP